MTSHAFLLLLEQTISRKHLLLHPFYQAWSRGELSLDCLREYAMQYYHHVKAFSCYLISLIYHTKDPYTRKYLLQNVLDEEGGSPNHPDLWRAFALRLGATEEQLEEHTPGKAMSALIDTFDEICRNGCVTDGLAGLYAYESQIPAVSESKIHGLQKYYHLQNPNDWKYFTVHIEADKEHAAVERELLLRNLYSSELNIDKKSEASALQAVQRVLDGLWEFLSSLCDQYQIALMC